MLRRAAELWLRLYRGWTRLSPPMILVLSFLALIAIGTAGLLWLPGLQRERTLSFLDALFTMTSAVCVTGLVVVDTGTWFTRAGQAWILLFIQLGGLGLVTLTSLIIGALGRRLSLRSELLVGVPTDAQERRSVVQLTLSVARYTLMVEAVGALMLWIIWIPRFGVGEGAWHAVFHAVSAFCNAGFSTFSDSLMSFSASPVTLLFIAVIIILGGLGFLSTEELLRFFRDRKTKRVRLSVHTFAAMWLTVILLAVGTVAYALAEWQMTLGGMSVVDKAVNAFFMSVTARTAGFNSVSYAGITNAAALLTIGLMLVGGNPGSTAGGLKTTTVAVLSALAWARIRGRRNALLHGRTIPVGTVQRTVSVLLMAAAIIFFAVFVLGIAESRQLPLQEARQAFLPIVFEVVSAFSTVGLSMDLTPALESGSRVLVIVLMFIGRVGPLAFFAAISLGTRPEHLQIRDAAEDLVVG